MRLLAFTFLVSAAIDWPAVWLDRAGAALVGLGFLALALPRGPRRRRAPLPFAAGLVPPAARDELDELTPEHIARVRAYLDTQQVGA